MNEQLQQLQKFANDFIIKHPQHKEEVNDLVQLCKDEIEEGGSVSHEIQLCMNDIEQLLL